MRSRLPLKTKTSYLQGRTHWCTQHTWLPVHDDKTWFRVKVIPQLYPLFESKGRNFFLMKSRKPTKRIIMFLFNHIARVGKDDVNNEINEFFFLEFGQIMRALCCWIWDQHLSGFFFFSFLKFLRKTGLKVFKTVRKICNKPTKETNKQIYFVRKR